MGTSRYLDATSANIGRDGGQATCATCACMGGEGEAKKKQHQVLKVAKSTRDRKGL